MPIDINSLQSQASDFLKSDQMQSVLPYLLSGGAGALAGGIMTGRQKGEKGESRGGYLSRVLRNALLAGGLASGGHYLLNKGVESTVGSLADDNALSGGDGNQSPLATTVKNVAFSPFTALGAGATALAATSKHPNIGAGSTADFMNRFAKETPGSPSAKLLSTATAEEIGRLGGDERVRRLAGLPSNVMEAPGSNKIHDLIRKVTNNEAGARELKGQISEWTRKGPLSVMGQSRPRRIGRGALGLAAAGVPALLGAFLTNESAS